MKSNCAEQHRTRVKLAQLLDNSLNRLLLALFLVEPAALQAQFTYVTNNGTITITKYNGTNNVVIIPDTITSLPVAAVGNAAFLSQTGVINVTISDNVTNIGNAAFKFCSALTNVSIGNGVFSIGPQAFQSCTRLPNVTIPDNVATIGNAAFASCLSLTTVTIGNGVANLPLQAFSNCTALANITIGSGLSNIVDDALSGCTNLDAINIQPGNPAFSSQIGVVFNVTRSTLVRFPPGRGGAYFVPAEVTTIGAG